jgi:type II secretion system protein D
VPKKRLGCFYNIDLPAASHYAGVPLRSRPPLAFIALVTATASTLAQTVHIAPKATGSPSRRIAQIQALATPPTQPGPNNPAPPGPPGPGAGQPATGTPAATSDMVKLQFPNSDVQDVLRFYEQLTGKRVVADNFVQGKVNITVAGSVPRDEAQRIIEMNLLMNGFSLIPSEPDIVKVLGPSKNPRASGIPIVSDPADIPPGEHIISYVFKLRYADPTELQQVLTTYLAGGAANPYSSVLALPKSSSLVVTENSTVIRAISKIIDQIDVEPAEVVSEFIPLQRADATKVVDMLKDIFEKNDQNRASGPGGVNPGGIRTVRGVVPNQPVPQPVGEDIAATGLSEDSVIVGKIKIAADVRTNRIHVITRPINLPFVRRLIEEFDANVQFAKPVTRPLRYISAADVLPVLVQALSEPGQNEQGATGGTAGPQAGPTPQRASNPTATNPYNAGESSTASGSNLNISEELSTQPVDTAPKSAQVGNTKLIADPRANTIIIMGNREVVVRVEKILDEMDVKAPQVTLSTVIGELTLNNDQEFGVDWFAHFKKTGNYSGVGGYSNNFPSNGNNGALPPIINPSSLGNISQIASSAAGGANVYIAAANTLNVLVSALDSTGRFKTISRPTVFTSNNKKAIIASGQEIPVPVSTLSNAVATTSTNNGIASVQSSIEFKKVALQLEVVPLINSEKEVSLDILQKIDSIVPNSNTNVGGGVLVPTIATRYIRTNVSAPNCSTIVLGGLIQENKQQSKSGIPYLDKIPLLGPLFRVTTHNHDRSELIILMRPEVTLTKLDLYRMRQKNEDRTHFGPELEQDDCPDCPKPGEDKQLPAPDIPSVKGL